MTLKKGKPMSVAECNAFQQQLARQRVEQATDDDDLLGGFEIEDNRVKPRTSKKKVAARRR